MRPSSLPAIPALLVLLASNLPACTDSGARQQADDQSSSTPALDAQPDHASSAPEDTGADERKEVQTAEMPPLPDEDLYPHTLSEQREAMFHRMKVMLGVSDGQMDKVRAIFERSAIIGQGNPEANEYPMTRKECRERRRAAGVVDESEPVCGAPYMVPIWDRSGGKSEADARVCIDRYEFPGIPCEYPVIWVRANEAAELCAAVGKWLCDAHEWEGACAGSVRPAEEEYVFGKSRLESEYWHNKSREVVWAYGAQKDHALCGTQSKKSETCDPITWKNCGSNTYPAGSFPACVSPFGVYDLHGNAAEHMNLPTKPEELASRGGLGYTEMKGSWFIFSRWEAHLDDCRFRAPGWHSGKINDPQSHANYHLGFRCCKSVETSGDEQN